MENLIPVNEFRGKHLAYALPGKSGRVREMLCVLTFLRES